MSRGLKTEIKDALFYNTFWFNKKYKKNNPAWITFDFSYFLLRFFLRTLFGVRNKDKVISLLGTESWTSKTILPDGNVVNYRLNDRAIIKEVYDMKSYDEISLDSDKPVLDIGGHIGLFSLKMSRNHKNKMYVFEPSRETFKLLEKNIKDNGLKNVEAFNLAVSDSEGLSKLYLHRYSAGNSLVSKSDKWVTIRNIDLNKFVKERGISDIELIKMDIEGSEYKVIKSSSNVLKRAKKLVLELHEGMLTKEEIAEIEKIITQSGFRHQKILENSPKVIYYSK